MKTFAYVFFFLFAWMQSNVIHAANYYWVGNSGDWDQYATHWATSSGGSVFHTQVPGSTDDVFFDANSFSAASSVTVPNVTAVCQNMDWSGVAYTVDFNGNPSVGYMEVYGILTLYDSLQWNFAGRLSMRSTAANTPITSAGVVLTEIAFGGSGSWILQDSLSAYEIGTYFGTLYSNNQTIHVQIFYMMLGNFEAGTSVIHLHGMKSFSGAPAPQLDADSAFFVFTLPLYLGSLSGEGGTYGSVFFDGVSGYVTGNNTIRSLRTNAYNCTFAGSNTFDTLLLSSPAGGVSFPGEFDTTIINDLFTGGGQSNMLMSMNCSQMGSYSIIIMNAGDTTCLDYVAMGNITGTGGGVFYAGANSTNYGNVYGWHFLPCATPVSVAENSPGDVVSIYPNPSSGEFVVDVPEGCDRVRVEDPMGNVVFAQNSTGSRIVLDLSFLAAGMYIVHLEQAGGNSLSQKIVKY